MGDNTKVDTVTIIVTLLQLLNSDILQKVIRKLTSPEISLSDIESIEPKDEYSGDKECEDCK
jgi:hypothetical protein